jgi:predicted anti-sigma-YlaC factor YlaD
MTRHVSTENLARFRGGDLSTARSARIAAHLRACARCRETSEALARVPSLLAAAQVPPMPAHLAARIESALATESAQRAAVESDSAPEHRSAAPSHRGARRRPQRPAMPALRVLATAGAAVALVGGFVALLTQLGTGSSSSTGDSGAAGGSHKAAAARPHLAPSLTFGAIHYQVGRHTAVITPQSSGTHYQSARLTQQVSRVIATSEHRLGGTALPNATANGSTSGGVTARSVPTGCVRRIAAGHRVQLVDIARFDGRSATIIVTAPHGQVAAQVFVVGAACSASASDLLAHRQLPRR